MVRQYRKFDEDFKSGAVRLVFETGKPIAQVARDLGVNEGTLGNWVTAARRQRDGGDGPLSEDERAELAAGAARTQLAEASPRSRSNKIGNHKSGVSTVSGDCRSDLGCGASCCPGSGRAGPVGAVTPPTTPSQAAVGRSFPAGARLPPPRRGVRAHRAGPARSAARDSG